MPGVVDVRFVERRPAEKRGLLSWEQVNYFRHDLMRAVCTLYITVNLFLSSFFILEKHLYFARGPARFLSDNGWFYTNLEH